RRVRGQAGPRRGVRRWHPRGDARRRGGDGDRHRPVGEIACGGAGARPALETDDRLPPRHRRGLGRWRPRRDFRPRVRGGRAGARRRPGAHHRRHCPGARARRRARFSDAQPHDRRIPAGRVGRGVRAAYHARGVPRLRTLHHAGGTERRARSPLHGGAGDEGRRAGGRRYRPASAHRRSERNLPRLGPPDALTVSRSWVEAILAAGVVPASYVPEASVGRTDVEEFTGADPVEDPELRVHSLAGARPLAPVAVGFLDGIEQWRVVGYAGVTPIVRAHVAAAIRLRGADRRPRTIAEAAEELAITRLDHLPAAVRAALEETGVSVVEISAEDAGQPARALPAARIEVQRARATLERRLAERQLSRLGADEWLVVDGVLSDSPTLPAVHRTSVFRPKSRGARREIHSWYLRLWPWEGNDLLYGLLRLEARAHPETVARASAISAWLTTERAPLATPDRRWDRLLYPIHDVETYLRARAPRDLVSHPASRIPHPGSRFPRTGS